MAESVYSVRISLDSVTIHDDSDLIGAGELYFIGNIGGHTTGRSPTRSLDSGTTVSLTGAVWVRELQVAGSSSIPITFEVWDEDTFDDESLGRISVAVNPPWERHQYTTPASSGKFTLRWSVSNTVAVPSLPSISFVSRNYDGSSYVTTLVLPAMVPMVTFTEILGLNKPAVDDRPVRPSGTTKNSGFQAGYFSQDDKGRIFTNRLPSGAWAKDQQYIDITVQVVPLPPGTTLPGGVKVKWSFTDPDDPTNEPHNVHPDVGRLLDPNDYTGTTKTGANASDNNPRGKATATPHFDTADPAFPLSGDETPVEIASGKSKVRFQVSDVAGDNFIVRAEAVHASFLVTIPGETGTMTVWDRIEIEYVKMHSAHELPIALITSHYEMACAQVDVSDKRVVTGTANMAHMGATEGAAYTKCESYCTKPTAGGPGQFTHEGDGGWFFMVAARRFIPAATATILYEGSAEAQNDIVRLPTGTVLAAAPAVVRVFDSTKIAGMSPPLPNNRDLHIKFRVASRTGRDLRIATHDFHAVDNPDVSFLDAHLGTYGFAMGSSIRVQVLSAGDDALVTAGISPGGTSVGGRHYFGGKLLVFTDVTTGPEVLITLCHELCHAFDNAHKCGNWDWERKPSRTACCMNYWFQFVLDDSTPRRPMAWTQNRESPNMCGPHIVSIRDYHLEDNPGLGW